jgi:hypothetical protein
MVRNARVNKGTLAETRNDFSPQLKWGKINYGEFVI